MEVRRSGGKRLSAQSTELEAMTKDVTRESLDKLTAAASGGRGKLPVRNSVPANAALLEDAVTTLRQRPELLNSLDIDIAAP